METFKNIQDALGWIPIDGIVISIEAYILAPPQDKIRNAVIIGLSHGFLHYYTCKIQNEDGLLG